MELVQELVFTISFSLIVSLLIAKLFSVGSSGNSSVSIRVEEKIEKEGNFDDPVKGCEEGGFGCLEGDLGSGVVVDCGGGEGAGCVFDESPERNEDDNGDAGLVKSDEGNMVTFSGSLVEEDCVKCVEVETESISGVGVCYVFDESPERTECKDDDDGSLVKSDEVNLVNSSGLLVQENCVKSVEVDTESGSGVGVRYVFDESPERTECKDGGGNLVKSDEGNVVNFTGSLVQEDCVKSVEVERVFSAINDGEVKVEEEDEMFDDDWQGVETTELERRFGAAVAFMDAKVNSGVVNLIDNEVKVELYGLHRVAIEGSCFEPQPMALKVSARANWNSWKRFENLGREDAMEQYIALLSRHVPGWMGSHSYDKQ
ncbi:putative acyl-CoA-binding protein, ACBP [Helianthus annuus]|nr:putative acyl-CoA-binding protein, ACBP [Helianthus annuus]